MKEEADAGEELGFDEQLERLEAIVAELEDGSLGLEEAIARYRAGIGHVKACHAILARYRKQVEELSEEADASLRAFEGDPDVSPE